MRDDDALLLAAGELVRVVVDARLGVGDADPARGSRWPWPAPRLRRELAVRAQPLGDLPADRVDRVQRRRRLLEDHGDVARRAPPAAACSRQRDDVVALPSQRARRRRGGAVSGSSPRMRLGGDGLAAAATRRRWPAPRRARRSRLTSVDGVDGAGVGGEGESRCWMSTTGRRSCVMRSGSGRCRDLRLEPAPAARDRPTSATGVTPPARRRVRRRGSARSLRLSPDQGDPEHDEHDREAGEDRRPPDPAGHVGDRLVEVVAPLRRRGRLDAEAEEAEAGEGEDRLRGVQREDQRQRPGRVAQHVPEHDPPVLRADDLRRLDERPPP